MKIAAGDADATHSFSVNTALLAPFLGAAYSNGILIHSAGLHMHNLGTRGRISLDGSSGDRCLLAIDAWDFHWQGSYRFDKPVKLPIGDTVKLECHWDNSQANQAIYDGEQLVARDVEWGEGTTDEMCLGVLYVSPP
ncbi:MAG: hypothetical protein IT381_07330 [Deltaproteobacteria bacterium]|nr:hypothetical protein [Deltaproteobacteria bacterium]